MKKLIKVNVFFLMFGLIFGLLVGKLQAGAIKHDPEDTGKHYHGHIHEEPGVRHYETIPHEEEPAPAPAPKVLPKMLRTTGAYPTGNKDCCSVLFMEKIAPSTGAVGQPYEYIIRVTNLIDRNVKDVEVIQNLPQNFQVESSDPEMGDGSGEGFAVWHLGEFGPKETKIIRVSGLPMQAGPMPFCTDITYRLPELCLEPVIQQPMLTLSKSGPSDVMLCDNIVYTFTVQNTGSGEANNVEIKESLPSGLKTLAGETNVAYKVGTLRGGEKREVKLTVKADRTGNYTNAATAVANGGLSADSNTTVTAVHQPVLTIAKTGPAKRYVGGDITYEIVVTNTGDGPAVSTVVQDTIPANTTFKSASSGGVISGRNVTWNLGTLQPNDSRTLAVNLRASSIGKAENRAVVSADCADSVSATAETEILGIPAILLEVVDVEDPIEVGDSVTYIITVTNQGSETSSNVRITCTLEDAMQYVSASGPTTASAEGQTVTFNPLPSLAPKAKASWKVIIKAADKGDVRFQVNMTDDRLERTVQETEATYFYE